MEIIQSLVHVLKFICGRRWVLRSWWRIYVRGWCRCGAVWSCWNAASPNWFGLSGWGKQYRPWGHDMRLLIQVNTRKGDTLEKQADNGYAAPWVKSSAILPGPHNCGDPSARTEDITLYLDLVRQRYYLISRIQWNLCLCFLVVPLSRRSSPLAFWFQ